MGVSSSQVVRTRPGIVVTLDALGTIYKFREPIITQYIKVAGRCGLREDDIRKGDFNKAFIKSFKELSDEYPNYGKGQLSSPRAWWKTVVNDAFARVVDEAQIPEHLGDELYDHFTSSAAYELYPDVKPFFASMRELKQQYSKPDDPPVFVGVISNSDPRVKSVLQSLGLRVGVNAMPKPESMADRTMRGTSFTEVMTSAWHDTYNPMNDIDFLSTSYEASAEKPDPAIFGHAAGLANLNFASKLEQQQEDWTPSLQTLMVKWKIARQLRFMKPSRFIHIGDDYEKDYLGAAGLDGVDAMHLVRDGEGHKTEDGATTVTDLVQAATAIRIIAAQELGKSDV